MTSAQAQMTPVISASGISTVPDGMVSYVVGHTAGAASPLVRVTASPPSARSPEPMQASAH